MILETDLIDKSKEYVESFLEQNLSNEIFYHDLEHTREVVNAVIEIGQASGLTRDQLETVLIAAWFHDTGYFKGKINHEKESKSIAENFLRDQGINEKKISEVGGCIIATKIPQRPTNLMEEVLCDADLYHLSTSEFFRKSELLRKEFSLTGNNEIKDKEWLNTNIKFLKKHNFFTDYAKEKLLPHKKRNLKKLKSIKNELEIENNINEGKSQEDGSVRQDDTSEKKKQEKRPNRGIETLFRITSRNHVDFSSMADNKANIMISINSIMMSIIFSVLFRRFEEYPNLIIPAILLSVVCTTTIIFAILATRPNLTEGVFTKEDILKRRTNLLFFGNFYKMPLADYEWGVRQLMKDRDFLYGSMIRDIYFLGKVLGRKYFLLRISYTIFMYGLIISVISFGVAVFFFPTHTI
ncbi:MAG: HD domain-containing protein [Cyclobacteriaceae bacterium]|nr:HD domain-containing protein [Cyclobacteriaceae bacterium]